MFNLILFTSVVGILIAYLYKKYARKIQLASKFNGPRAFPIIGSGHLFFNKTAPEVLKTTTQLFRKYGKVVKLWIGPELVFIVTDPKDVEVILSSQKLITKSSEYTFLQKWLGDGLLLSTGKKWFSRRKIITPTFHFKILEQFVEIFDHQGNIYIEQLSKYTPKDKIDFYPLVTLCALDVICESSMGTTANAQKNSDSKYVEAVKTIANIVHLRMFDFLLRFDFLFKYTPSARRESKALEILHGFTDKVIISRREELIRNQSKQEINKEEEDLGMKKKMALLDVLLQSTIDGKPLTNMDIREEVDTFMFEGHDTTTSGISFALYNIAKHPEVQKKIVKEISEVIGDDKTKSVTQGDLNKLHYMDLVIKESMRMFPPVPFIGRKMVEDTVINNKIYPAGANVFVAPYFMGLDSTLFENAEKFIPERFDVERNVETMNPYAYVPFSAGPRNCIGQKFAMLEMKSIISKTLRHFEISVADTMKEPILVAELILRPENGVILQIKKR